MYYTDNPVGFYTKTNIELNITSLSLLLSRAAKQSTAQVRAWVVKKQATVQSDRTAPTRLIPFITISLTIGIDRVCHCGGKPSERLGACSALCQQVTQYQNTEGSEVTAVLTVPSEQFISLLRYTICLCSASALPVYPGISHQLRKEPRDHGANATLSA